MAIKGIDFKIDPETFDLVVERSQCVPDYTGVSSLLTALHTDERYNGKGGHWSNGLKSILWSYNQSRLSDTDLKQLQEDLNRFCRELEANELFDEVSVTVERIDKGVKIIFRCINDDNVILTTQNIV